jgi:hypothetical protein
VEEAYSQPYVVGVELGDNFRCGEN